MEQLALSNLYERGLRRFDSLSSLERDVFVIHDVNLYCEMEGDLMAYVLNGMHVRQVGWLSDALQRIGDGQSSDILAQLIAASEGDHRQGRQLSSEFHSLMESRWKLVEQYLEQQGARLVD